MPGRGWKHLQLAGIEFADAWSGSEVSAICWYWICRCLVVVGSICNLLVLDLQIHIGVNSGCGSICNLLVLNLQMPGRGWKHLQFADIGLVDTYPGFGSICNLLDLDLQMPITKLILRILQQLRRDCFLCRKRAKCSRRLAEHIVLKYNKASHFFLFFTGNCI